MPDPHEKNLMTFGLIVAAVASAFFLISITLESGSGKTPSKSGTDVTEVDALSKEMSPQTVPWKDGVAVVILVDVSSSMKETIVSNANGKVAKIRVAKNCLLSLTENVKQYADAHPNKEVHLGIMTFSNQVSEIVDLGPLDMAKTHEAVEKIEAYGWTSIGDAMVAAKKRLNDSMFVKTHIVVITDGENTRGRKPVEVVQSIAKMPYEQQSQTYIIGFDIAAERFDDVRSAGSTVLSAENDKELSGALEYILENRILVEAQDQ